MVIYITHCTTAFTRSRAMKCWNNNGRVHTGLPYKHIACEHTLFHAIGHFCYVYRINESFFGSYCNAKKKARVSITIKPQ